MPSLHLPADTQTVDFISDLHLSASMPRTLAAFEAYLAATPADALFILGDLFEVWPGDDVLGEPFEQLCAGLLRDAAGRRPVHVMRGNRDFLFGPRFFEATGTHELADPTAVQAFGRTVLLSHGDALCLADTAYQQFRAQVRRPAWQAAVLAKPLAERLALASQMRDASRAHNQGRDPVTFADADPALASAWLADAGAAVLVHGHTHRPASEQRPEGWQRHVLSDWDLDHAGPGRAEVLRWTAAGFQRLPLSPSPLPA
ncbi:MAG TPA: UDP-2,3-diacylglucosamine diphosphatase [Ideonella sp.]|nr:UDP-2,3-diacylglucosamine diphosphatase [Ideonella sp.]